MNFLLNNPVVTFLLLLVLTFTVLMVIKIVMEIKLNDLLKQKHRKMRINMPGTYVKTRIAWMSLGTLTPTALILIMVVIGLGQGIDYNNERLQITSASDITSIFNDFNDRIDDNYIDYTYDLRTNTDMFLDTVFTTALTEQVLNTGLLYSYSGTGTGSNDYSITNNQVTGVDEMDNVLTDGLNIYSYYDLKVTVTRAFTIEEEYEVLEVLKVLDYQDYSCEGTQFVPNGIYVDDDYLIVIGYETTTSYCGIEGVSDYIDKWYYNLGTTMIKVYDKDEFTLVDNYEFQGTFKGTRKIDNNLFIITSHYLPFVNEDINVEDNLPYYELNDSTVTVDYEDISYVEGTIPSSFTSFYGINLDTKEVDVEVILGDSGYNIYVSNNNIYIEGVIYNYFPVADFVNIEQPFIVRTAINKISFEGNDLTFVATGYVEGTTINQFSLDEHNGFLRVVTTEGSWGEAVVNRITILDEFMEEASVIDEGLGLPGERVTASRLVGDYGYVVTYLMTDPFYTIDLSDPYNPELLDILKITGFSTYLQPLTDDYMFGIGFGDNDGGSSWVRLEIYDISNKFDVPPPISEVLDDEIYGYGWSSANHEHKDLLIDVNKGIVAIPFSSGEYDLQLGYIDKSGVLVFDMDLETGFEFNGFISHYFNSEDNVYGYKSEFIDDYLYVVSSKYISVSSIDDTGTILKIISIND